MLIINVIAILLADITGCQTLVVIYNSGSQKRSLPITEHHNGKFEKKIRLIEPTNQPVVEYQPTFIAYEFFIEHN